MSRTFAGLSFAEIQLQMARADFIPTVASVERLFHNHLWNREAAEAVLADAEYPATLLQGVAGFYGFFEVCETRCNLELKGAAHGYMNHCTPKEEVAK